MVTQRQPEYCIQGNKWKTSLTATRDQVHTQQITTTVATSVIPCAFRRPNLMSVVKYWKWRTPVNSETSGFHGRRVRRWHLWDIVPCSLVDIKRRFGVAHSIYYLEAARTYETSVNFYKTAWNHDKGRTQQNICSNTGYMALILSCGMYVLFQHVFICFEIFQLHYFKLNKSNLSLTELQEV
jgi:hypothetical protein